MLKDNGRRFQLNCRPAVSLLAMVSSVVLASLISCSHSAVAAIDPPQTAEASTAAPVLSEHLNRPDLVRFAAKKPARRDSAAAKVAPLLKSNEKAEILGDLPADPPAEPLPQPAAEASSISSAAAKDAAPIADTKKSYMPEAALAATPATAEPDMAESSAAAEEKIGADPAAADPGAAAPAKSSVAPAHSESPPVQPPRKPEAAAAPDSNGAELKSSGGIRGTVTINFDSRVHEEGIDTYTVDLTAGQIVSINGEIKRSGRKLSSFLRRETQPIQYLYALKLLSPSKDKSQLGLIEGIVPFSSAGIYKLDGLKYSGGGQTSLYSGTIKGRGEEKPGIFGSTYTRIFGGKKVVIKIQKSDPLRFNGVRLPAGPAAAFPASTVSGNLDYDYDTGNWLSSGILFQYGTGERDKIAGSIKWIPDPKRNANGKGQYEFNLRYNEDRFTKTPDEEEFFQTVSDEEAFFAVDNRIPALSGVIRYQDTFGPPDADGEPTVIETKAIYELDSKGLTDQQIVAFLKLWLLIAGPVNDE